MKIVIADDETLARNRMRRLIGDLPLNCEVVAEAGNGVEAVQACQDHAPDMVLLDIRMPCMDGLQAAVALAKMDQPPAVVFVTAYEDHAVEAFETQAIDYLLKPVRMERLQQALEKAQRWSAQSATTVQRAMQAEAQPRQHLCAHTSNGLVLVPVDQVRCFVADHKYVSVYTDAGEWLIDDALKDLEHEYGEAFIRVHRNALVARAFIRCLQRGADGQQLLSLDGIDLQVSVSRRQLPGVRQAIRHANKL